MMTRYILLTVSIVRQAQNQWQGVVLFIYALLLNGNRHPYQSNACCPTPMDSWRHHLVLEFLHVASELSERRSSK